MSGKRKRHTLTYPYTQQSARWHVEEAANALREGKNKSVRPDTARDHLEMALRAFDLAGVTAKPFRDPLSPAGGGK